MKNKHLRFEAYYAESIERVWKTLTEPSLLAEWLTQGDFKLKRGHRFKWIEPAGKTESQSSPMEGATCEIQEINAPHRLSYRVEHSADSTSIVTWILEPVGEGTNVIIEQELLVTAKLKPHPTVVSMALYLRNRTLIKLQMELMQKLQQEIEIAA